LAALVARVHRAVWRDVSRPPAAETDVLARRSPAALRRHLSPPLCLRRRVRRLRLLRRRVRHLRLLQRCSIPRRPYTVRQGCLVPLELSKRLPRCLHRSRVLPRVRLLPVRVLSDSPWHLRVRLPAPVHLRRRREHVLLRGPCLRPRVCWPCEKARSIASARPAVSTGAVPAARWAPASSCLGCVASFCLLSSLFSSRPFFLLCASTVSSLALRLAASRTICTLSCRLAPFHTAAHPRPSLSSPFAVIAAPPLAPADLATPPPPHHPAGP
jgi:hypothetical protein